MMKQVKFKLPLRSLAIAGGLFLSATAFAQSGSVRGQVKDASGEPIIGATIMANGKPVGVTDLDGNYVVNVPQGTEITITYVGMTPRRLRQPTISLQLSKMITKHSMKLLLSDMVP